MDESSRALRYPGTADWRDHCMSEDLRMYGQKRWRASFRVTRGPLYLQRLLRKSEYWSHPSRRGALSRVMSAVYKVRYRRISDRLGIEVPRYVAGPGLSIAHSGLLVVSTKATIGQRCRIHQGVTIGGSLGGAPSIGDDVFISANAIIVGPVTVGDEAFIYPGAVCSIDVPEKSSAAGVPARVTGKAAPPPWGRESPAL